MTRRTASLTVLSALTAPELLAALPRPAGEITVKLPGGKGTRVSDYKGKTLVLVFILTTCKHCQRTCRILAGMNKELLAKGGAVVVAAINNDPPPDISAFVKTENLPFTVGEAVYLQARAYMQMSDAALRYVPWFNIIDGKGQMRTQYTGGEQAFFDEDNGKFEQNIRSAFEKIAFEGKPQPAPTAKAPAPVKTSKK